MRTTLDIGEDIFYAAKDYARASKLTMGEVITAWAREKFAAPTPALPLAQTSDSNAAAAQFAALGFATFPKRTDACVISNETVNQLRQQEGI